MKNKKNLFGILVIAIVIVLFALPIVANAQDTNPVKTGTDWTVILNIVISVVAVIFGGIWAKSKGKVKQFANLGQQVMEVIEDIDAAIADNNISKEEMKKISADAQDVKTAFKELISLSK